MGGFKLTGPNYVFEYVYESDLRCACSGLRMVITDEQEKKLLNTGKRVISAKEFHAIFDDKHVDVHTYVGEKEDPEKQIMRYTAVRYKKNPHTPRSKR